MERKIRNVPFPSVLFLFCLAFSFISRIPYAVIWVISPSFSLCFHLWLFMTSILVTNLNYSVKNLSFSSKVFICGRKSCGSILSDWKCWCLGWMIFIYLFLRHSVCKRQNKYSQSLWLSLASRHPSLSLKEKQQHVASFLKLELTETQGTP